MQGAKRWLMTIALVAFLGILAGCSDDAQHPVDLGSDTGQPDGGVEPDLSQQPIPDLGFPGCAPPCAAGEVCNAGKCEVPGPALTCGSSDYPSGLPSDGSGVIYVNASHTGSSDGTKSAPFKTIAAALAKATAPPGPSPDAGVKVNDGGAAPDGTVAARPIIAVATGIYEEELQISTSVDLRCRCSDKVRITGPVTVKAETSTINVVIEGCEIAPKGHLQQPSDWGTCYTSSKKSCKQPADCTSPEICDPVDLECVHAMADKDRGLKMLSGEAHGVRLAVRDSVVAGWCNGIHLNTGSTSASALCLSRSRIWGNHKGLEVENAPPISGKAVAPECTGLEEAVAATLSQIDHNEYAGVYTRSLARGVGLRANMIAASGRLQTPGGLKTTSEPGGFGVYLGNTSSTHIEANVIRENEDVGIGMINSEVIADTTFEIRDNLLADNGNAGISLQQLQATKEVKIINNQVSGTRERDGTDGDGIQVLVAHGTSYKVRVEGNQMTGSKRNGVVLDGVSGAVDSNIIAGSGGYGVLLQQAPAVTVGPNTFGSNTKGNVYKSQNPVELCGALPLPLP